MSRSSQGAMIVLEGAPYPSWLPEINEMNAQPAAGVLQAAALLARSPTSLLVINSDWAWHRSFVQSLSAEVRPPVVVTGGRTLPSNMVDARPETTTPDEAARSIRRALMGNPPAASSPPPRRSAHPVAHAAVPSSGSPKALDSQIGRTILGLEIDPSELG